MSIDVRHAVGRRSLMQGSAWLVPSIAVSATAPMAAASPVKTCPVSPPVLGYGPCVGAPLTGAFTFTIMSTQSTYTVVVLRVETQSYVASGWTAWTSVTSATWTPTAPTVVAPGANIAGTGSVPSFSQPLAHHFRVFYSLLSDGFPEGGCEYHLNLAINPPCP